MTKKLKHCKGCTEKGICDNKPYPPSHEANTIEHHLVLPQEVEDNRDKMMCPKCKIGYNAEAYGGNSRCFHCDSCSYVECEQDAPFKEEESKENKIEGVCDCNAVAGETHKKSCSYYICPICHMDKRIRNPSGHCDHLFYPENVTKPKEKKTIQCPECSGINNEHSKTCPLVVMDRILAKVTTSKEAEWKKEFHSLWEEIEVKKYPQIAKNTMEIWIEEWLIPNLLLNQKKKIAEKAYTKEGKEITMELVLKREIEHLKEEAKLLHETVRDIRKEHDKVKSDHQDLFLKYRLLEESKEKTKLKIEIQKADGMQGFAAYIRSPAKSDKRVVLLNVIASLEAAGEGCKTWKEATESIRRVMVENLMHEFGHVMEQFFNLEVNEEFIEKVVESYEDLYGKTPYEVVHGDQTL